MKFNKKITILILAFVLGLSGCQGTKDIQENQIDQEASEVNLEGENNKAKEEVIENKESEMTKDQKEQTENDLESNNELDTDQEKQLTEEDILKYQPNELGRIMVIMYHSLGTTEGYYVSTPDILRSNLKTLYKKDYVLVSLKDFVNNTMDIPLGKTPVVLTFDDGHQSNFNIIEEGDETVVDPDSAVGIIDDFYQNHPDFNRHGSFFLNSNHSFSQKHLEAYKLNYLIENGYDVGNHTYGHEDLSISDKETIQRTIALNKKKIEEVLNGYNVNTLALPFGKRPKDEFLEESIYSGVYEGVSYENIAVLNVGWNPTYSPLHKKFNYKSINRVQSGSGDFQLNYWIEYFDKNPDKRYISDGILNQVTIPKRYEEHLNNDLLEDRELFIYEREIND